MTSGSAQDRTADYLDSLREISASVFERVLRGERAAEEELYRLVGRSLAASAQGWYTDFDDDHHDAYLLVLASIKGGNLRNPTSLLGFIRTVSRRRFATRMTSAARDRRRSTNLAAITSERAELDKTVHQHELWGLVDRGLSMLGDHDRELIRRFYILGDTREEVMNEMGLDDTRYRLSKCRALKRLSTVVQRFGRLNAEYPAPTTVTLA